MGADGEPSDFSVCQWASSAGVGAAWARELGSPKRTAVIATTAAVKSGTSRRILVDKVILPRAEIQENGSILRESERQARKIVKKVSRKTHAMHEVGCID